MRRDIILVTVAAVLLLARAVSAAGHESGKGFAVSALVGDDLYTAGAKILVSEPVEGDAVAAGGSVIVNDRVGADLQAAGGSIIINAPVQDDLRAAGGDVLLSSDVGGDLVVFGGSVTVPDGVVVTGDAVVSAGRVHIGGEVRGSLQIRARAADLTGSVGGDARIYAEERLNLNGTIEGAAVFAGRQATLGPQARFGKDVTYWTPGGEMDFTAVPTGGPATYDPGLSEKLHDSRVMRAKREVKKGMAAAFGGFFILTLLSGTAIIIAATLLLKGPFYRAGEELHRSFWKSLGFGVLIFILLPAAGLLCLATIIGIPLGLFLIAVFFFALLFGRVIAAVTFAAWLDRRSFVTWSTGRFILVSIGLYVAIKAVSIVPLVGWLAVLLAVWAGWGALLAGNRGEKAGF